MTDRQIFCAHNFGLPRWFCVDVFFAWKRASTVPVSSQTRTITTPEQVLQTIKQERVEFIDLRFTDMRGVQHHMDFPADAIGPDLFEKGKMFDGSSIARGAGTCLRSTGIGDAALLGPGPESFIFDEALWRNDLYQMCDSI